MRIGFIGTGVISSAMVNGICTSELAVESIWVSPRNREKANELTQTYEIVRIGESNQMVVDHSDIVVLGILPQDMEKILNDLEFRPDQIVIHLLAGIKTEALAPCVAPAEQIVRAVPLPCVSIHKGPVAMYPENKVVCRLFDALGTNILADNEQQLDTLSIITALMAPYYTMLDTVVNWAVNEGISRKNAADYTISMFEVLSIIAQGEGVQDGDLKSLIHKSMTPGGLNELAMNTIQAQGGFDNLLEALQNVKKKLD